MQTYRISGRRFSAVGVVVVVGTVVAGQRSLAPWLVPACLEEDHRDRTAAKQRESFINLCLASPHTLALFISVVLRGWGPLASTAIPYLDATKKIRTIRFKLMFGEVGKLRREREGERWQVLAHQSHGSLHAIYNVIPRHYDIYRRVI